MIDKAFKVGDRVVVKTDITGLNLLPKNLLIKIKVAKDKVIDFFLNRDNKDNEWCYTVKFAPYIYFTLFEPELELHKNYKWKVILSVVLSVLMFITATLSVSAGTWEDITNPDKPITVINTTSNIVVCGNFSFKPFSTNDLGRSNSREIINRNIFSIYNAILSGRLTNIVSGHVPVSNF